MAHVSVAVMAVVAMAALIGCQAQRGTSCRDSNGQSGTCTNIGSCPLLRQLLAAIRTNTAPPNAVQTLRQSVCELRSGQILVCCALGGGNITPPPATGGGASLLPNRCGTSGLTDRIIDGEDAPLLAWPWMVELRGKLVGLQASTWFCGGVLINDRYVLTAAHCFKPAVLSELEYVRLGEHTFSTNPDCENGLCAPSPQNIGVEQIIRHPQYGSPCKECNDIALLRLARPAQLHPLHVIPVCLPLNPVEDMGFPEEEFQGKFAWAAGWGSISRDPHRPFIPDVLQQVQLPIGEGRFCNNLRSAYPDTRSTLCSGGEGKDTCKGDSGGPLLLTSKGGTKNFVVGITSLGPTVCGQQNTQGLYTSVVYYMQWILQTIRP